MIKHVSVFTLKDKSEIKHFVEMLEEIGEKCPLIIKSEIGVNMSEQPPVGPHFGDVIQTVEFLNVTDLEKYPQSKEHQKLLIEGPEMKTVTAIDYII
ncbi:MAG TPA: Dabb family protein [Coprobacillaceae bacterium]|uniref:Dabb family protein n=1 Tax=Faecalibacillus intestinalis TaxID=1982626 RepID=UPI0029FF21DD|nr:Dabb family protein [Coprobacillaceae bacterium]